MTEHEWWHGRDPDAMIDWLFYDLRAATRKFRLFWVAACRELLPLVPDYPELAEFLDLIEHDTDLGPDERRSELWETASRRLHAREATEDEVRNACSAIAVACDNDRAWLDPRSRDRSLEIEEYGGPPGMSPRHVTDYCDRATSGQFVARHIALLHEVFGPLPFRDPLDPSWLTSDVVALARGIYEEKAFDRMPILADALQDAGCHDEEVLKHCRKKPHRWEHVRGCWVVDLLLGRPWK